MTCNPRHRVLPVPRQQVPAGEALARSRAFLEAMRTRRTVRDFSDRPVPFELVRNAVATAATASSGANLQPWRFVVVSDPERKRRLRVAAEKKERPFVIVPVGYAAEGATVPDRDRSVWTRCSSS
jgi:iodotyrosine deiodinase